MQFAICEYLLIDNCLLWYALVSKVLRQKIDLTQSNFFRKRVMFCFFFSFLRCFIIMAGWI